MIGNIVNTYAIAQLETTRLVLQIDNEDKNTLLLKDSTFHLKEKSGRKNHMIGAYSHPSTRFKHSCSNQWFPTTKSIRILLGTDHAEQSVTPLETIASKQRILRIVERTV